MAITKSARDAHDRKTLMEYYEVDEEQLIAIAIDNLAKTTCIESKNPDVLMGIATGYKQAAGRLFISAQEHFLHDKPEIAEELKHTGFSLEHLARKYLTKSEERGADPTKLSAV